jgi:hypothetical protein
MDVSGQTHTLLTLLPEKEPGFYGVGAWVGDGAGLDVLEKD